MKISTMFLGLISTLPVVSAEKTSTGLRAEPALVSLSAVKDQPAVPATLTLVNPGSMPLPAAIEIAGRDAAAFRVIGETATLAPGGKIALKVGFTPITGFGRYSAELKVGNPNHGTTVRLEAVGLNAFEGKNEPPLQLVADTLGIPIKVGSEKLELDVKADRIGDGVPATRFRAIPGKKVRVTPLARFSPPGATPFGWVTRENDLHELGQLADSSQRPDTHQALLPSLAGGANSVEFTPPAESFAFYMKGHLYTAFTDPALPSKAGIPHTTRVFPVTSFQGKTMTHSYLIGCEEASNGDYQDAVFLLENVTHE